MNLQNGIYAFIGTNGAGKSTLMNILTGTIPKDSGEIYFEGQKDRLEKTAAEKIDKQLSVYESLYGLKNRVVFKPIIKIFP